MHVYEYGGFTICPVPALSLADDVWTVNLSIRRGARAKSFETTYSFRTKGEAVFHCISLGKKIIDGDVDGFTVDDIL